MRWMIAGTIGAAAAALMLSGVFWSGNSQKQVAVHTAQEASLPSASGKEGKAAAVLPSETVQPQKDGASAPDLPRPSLTEEEKAYNRMVALEKREERMRQRTVYLQARTAWRRELNAAVAAARVSGDGSEVERIKALEPDKKAFLSGG
jgi:hypothetical protein